MNKRTIEVLEFDKLLSVLSGFASSEPGRKACTALSPSTDSRTIREQLEEVSEMLWILRSQRISFSFAPSAEDVLKRVIAGEIVLSPADLLALLSLISASREASRALAEFRSVAPLLAEISGEMVPVDDLEERIRKCITPEGAVSDGASPRLAGLRKEISETKAAIHGKLESILQSRRFSKIIRDRIITLRNDRYVIPVSSDYKGYIDGIVHDQSHSGATIFLEPGAVIDGNNRLNLLRNLEQEEERRILEYLTASVKENAGKLLQNLRTLTRLDVIRAKAEMCISFNMSMPVIDGNGHLNIVQARHPLLVQKYRHERREEEVVPIDIRFPAEKHLMIISGANAGGKTVALKTIGLLQLMAQSGMFVPAAEGSVLPVFENILAEIGDEQDIEYSLSTFSAKVKRLVEMTELAGERTLALIDEIGAGTDPEEGGALAISFLEYMRGKRARVVATTHSGLVKNYGLSSDDAVSVSVMFDEETLRPLYRLIYGVPGVSNAVAVASMLGMPAEIIEGTRRWRTDYDRSMGEILRKLAEKQRVLQEVEKELSEAIRNCRKLIEQLCRFQDTVRAEVGEALNKWREEIRESVRRAKRDLRSLVRDLRSLGQEVSPASWVKLKEIEKAAMRPFAWEAALDKKVAVNEDSIKPGMLVTVTGMGNRKAKILQVLRKSGMLEVQLDGKRWRVPLGEVSPVGETSLKKGGKKESAGQDGWTDQATDILPARVNIIGMRVEEALPVVDKEIDKAILDGRTVLEIVHGVGEGKLRKAVHEYLKQHVAVREFDLGRGPHTNWGVTVVKLK